MVHKIGAVIEVRCGYGQTGISDLMIIIYDESGNIHAGPTAMTEITNGLYKYQFTPDAAGMWTAYIYRGATKVGYITYEVEEGVEVDVETKVDTVDTVVDAIKLETDGVDAHVTSEVDDLITRTKGLDDIHDDLAAEITREAGSTTEGTFAHPSGTTEQDIVVLTITKRTLVKSALFDAVNLTKSTTFRAYTKIDGTNWRQIDDNLDWTTSSPDGVLFVGLTHDHDVKFTMQSVVAEGVSRDVPYSIIKEEMVA